MNELVELGTGIAASVAAGGFALDRWVARPVAVGFVAGALAVAGSGWLLTQLLHIHLATLAGCSSVWGH